MVTTVCLQPTYNHPKKHRWVYTIYNTITRNQINQYIQEYTTDISSAFTLLRHHHHHHQHIPPLKDVLVYDSSTLALVY